MKKGLLLLMMVMLTLALPVVALAEGAVLDGQSFFGWEDIGTFGGAVALTVFVVQFLKLPLDKVWRIPTRFVVYGVSLVVLLLAQMFIPGRGGLTWDSSLQCLFNAALVSLSAMSAYTVLIEKVELDTLVARGLESGDITITEEVTADILIDEPPEAAEA